MDTATSVAEEDYVDDAPITMPRRPADVEMDITPMIDITFLLLIFFLVASKMNAEQAVTLPPAKHGLAVAPADAVVILVKYSGEDRAVIMKADGTEFSAADLQQQEDDIYEYTVAGLNGSPPFDKPRLYIMIKAEVGVRHGEVSRVAIAAGKAAEEGQQMYIGVLETN